MATQSASRKRKGLSKNKKKSWRKTDIQDVEDYLEDKRVQEITGGLVAEKTDEQLFFVDTSVEAVPSDEPVTKRRRGTKPLKCHALLEPDPNIKPARVKHNIRNDGIHKRCTATQTRLAKGLLTVTQKQAKLNRHKALLEKSERNKKTRKLPITQRNLWGVDDSKNEVDEFYLKQTRQKRKKPPSNYNSKSSVTPSIELPHPGSSYNPAYDDHQDLLQKALAVELLKQKEELKIKRAIDDKIPKRTAQQVENQWLSEMSAGLHDQDLATESDEDIGDLDKLSVNPPVRREDKKTERQRRKTKAREEKVKSAVKVKKEKLRKRQVFQLRSIKKAVSKRTMFVAEQQERKTDRREQRSKLPKKLGKHKFEEADLEIKLSEELKGSLRHLKPEGHLFEDRFKSLQKRNIIESRGRAKNVRRYKQKQYTKKSHKDIV